MAVAKTMAGVKKICKDACRMAGAVQETSSSVSALMSRDGLHFGASNLRLNMISRDRCSPSYDLASLFHGRRSTLDRWHGKNAKRVGTKPPALLNLLFLKKVVQNCFVFAVVNFDFVRKSGRISSFWSCELPCFEKVSPLK